MFILAHITDPHLGPLPKASLGELANKRITGFVNWHRTRKHVSDPMVLGRLVAHLHASPADHIAATGDFANIALPAEFPKAAEFLARLGPPHDVTAIAGNHDDYVKGGMAMLQAACGDYMQGDDGSRDFPFVRRRGPVAIVALNTAVPTLPFLATGRLGKQQLKRLGLILAMLKREHLFRVILIHHPPVSERPWTKRLSDARALWRVIAQHGAELILHGHDHVHDLHWLVGPERRVPAVGLPSASATAKAKAPGAYNLYYIDGFPGGWRCEMESRGIGADGRVTTIKKTALLG